MSETEARSMYWAARGAKDKLIVKAYEWAKTGNIPEEAQKQVDEVMKSLDNLMDLCDAIRA